MAHVPRVAEPTGTFSSRLPSFWVRRKIQSDAVRPVERNVSYDPPYQEAETAGKTPDRAQGLNSFQISGLRCLGTDKLPC